MKCRLRFKKRRQFRQLLESTVINGFDDRPFAEVKILDEVLVEQLVSEANISLLGKDCLPFLEKVDLKHTPLNCK